MTSPWRVRTKCRESSCRRRKLGQCEDEKIFRATNPEDQAGPGRAAQGAQAVALRVDGDSVGELVTH